MRQDTREVLVPSYWIRSREGAWYEVSEAVWRVADPGRALSVYR